MTNLAKFLQAMADGISEHYEALEAREGESRESLGLRDYFTQLLVVADAVGPDEALDWLSLDDRVGIDLEPDPRHGFERLSADSVEVGEAIAVDVGGLPDLSEPPRIVSETRAGGVNVYLEFADGLPGAGFAFDEVLWRLARREEPATDPDPSSPPPSPR